MTTHGFDRISFRFGFAVDVAGYSARGVPDQLDVQRRLHALVGEALASVGIDGPCTDSRGTGDGMIVLFPEGAQFQYLLPTLLRVVAERLAFDNGRHADRIRLRLAATVGPVGHGAIGFSHRTVTEMCRLLDAPTLRQALAQERDADVVVLLSNALYEYVVAAGYPGLAVGELRRVRVQFKGFEARAWLWTAARPSRAPW